MYLMNVIFADLKFRVVCPGRQYRRNSETAKISVLQYQLVCTFLLSQIVTVIGWCMCFVAVSVVVYAPYRGTLEIRDMDISVIGSFYMAIAKPLWACAISWIIIACATGNGGRMIYVNNIYHCLMHFSGPVN